MKPTKTIKRTEKNIKIRLRKGIFCNVLYCCKWHLQKVYALFMVSAHKCQHDLNRDEFGPNCSDCCKEDCFPICLE